jgi:hypothetical protein
MLLLLRSFPAHSLFATSWVAPVGSLTVENDGGRKAGNLIAVLGEDIGENGVASLRRNLLAFNFQFVSSCLATLILSFRFHLHHHFHLHTAQPPSIPSKHMKRLYIPVVSDSAS